jgi:NAD dependent epimerase/dehydratase
MTDQLRNRRVLVTGAGGFIGSHLVAALVAAGAAVRALVRYNSRNHWGALEHLPERESVDVRAGDIRDPFFVDASLDRVEIVFHLAALVSVPYAYIAPAQFIATNVTGTLNVLEAARRHGVRRVLHTSSSEVYGSARYTPIDERHPLQAQSPYAASKIGAEKLAESYWHSFATPVVVLRPFNTYGPRQSARAFLPSILTQALAGGVIRVGSLDPVRDMNHVDDTVAGLVAAAIAPDVDGLTINLGSGQAVSMAVLLEIALRAVGRQPPVEVDPERRRPEASEVRELVCDPARARDRLGWQSRVRLEDGVRQTAAWIAEHLDQYAPQRYSV